MRDFASFDRWFMEVIYEDNHIIVVNKLAGEIVQGDKTGDKPLCDEVREYIKEKYAKPGNVFCGVVHRIDRPASGLVIFAKTSKALSRLNDMLRRGEIHKRYRAIVQGHRAKSSDHLTHYLNSIERNNKTYVCAEGDKQGRLSELEYEIIGRGDRYDLLDIKLITGRKHQIRCQLSATGTPIKGDLKYGARRSNPDGGISLLAYRLEFVHPVSRKLLVLTAPMPDDPLWRALTPGSEADV